MAFRSVDISTVGTGTRPGLHSQTLISTGQADLDKLLGGGIPLGAVLLIQEDVFTQLHSTLLRYFVAEGVACGHQVQWAVTSTSGRDPLESLPQLVEPSSQPKEPEAANATEEDRAGLRIAWQYRRYIADRQKVPEQPRRHGSAFQRKQSASAPAPAAPTVRDWCHSFDLTRPMKQPERGSSCLERQSYAGSGALEALLADAHSLRQRISGDSPSQKESTRLWIQDPQPPTSAAAMHTSATEPGNEPSDPQSRAPAGPAALGASPGGSAPQQQAALPMARLPNESSQDKPVRRLMTSMSTRAVHPPVERPPNLVAQQNGRSSLAVSTAFSSMSVRSASSSQQAAALQPTQSGPGSVGRLAVQSLGSHSWGAEIGSRTSAAAVLQTVHRLKGIASGSRMAVMLSVPTGMYGQAFAARLQHICDAVLEIEAVSDESDVVQLIPDPASCCGLLRVQKLPGANTLAPPQPESPLYLIRHKRRRIALEPFEVDPDAEAALASSERVGVAPQAASLLCGGPPTAANKPFDF